MLPDTGQQTFTSPEALAAVRRWMRYIAFPNSFHAPQAIMMMEHGKHVLCETPGSFICRGSHDPGGRRHGVVLMEAMRLPCAQFFR